MNKISATDRARILHFLCEGSSICAVTHLTHANKSRVVKLRADTGKVCTTYHEKHGMSMQAKRVQIDEIWSFVHTKEKNVADAEKASEGAGTPA